MVGTKFTRAGARGDNRRLRATKPRAIIGLLGFAETLAIEKLPVWIRSEIDGARSTHALCLESDGEPGCTWFEVENAGLN